MGKSKHEQVMESVEDRFYEERQFSSASDIVDWTGISRGSVDSIIDDLQGRSLFKVYESDGNPTIYVTKQMKNSLTSQVGEPDWIENYEFQEKRELRDEVEEANNRIAEYQELERLLFGGGTPLEDSVETALTELGFNPDGTESEEDLEIEHDRHTWVIEIKGVSGQIKKKHITQLGGWLDKKIDEGMKASELTGLLVGNHDKNTPPEDRGEPLTDHATEFLNLRGSKYISTVEIHNIIKDVKENDEHIEDARQKFLELIQ